MTASKSLTLFEMNTYGIRLEYTKDYAIVHMPYTNKMTKEVFLDMVYRLEDWWEFLKTVGYKAIWCAVDPTDLKINKLVNKLGFTEAGMSDGLKVYKFGELE